MNDTFNPIKTLFFGVVFLLVGFWFWHSMMGNPLSDLALLQRGQQAAGKLVETQDHEEEDHRGNIYFSDVGIYAFQSNGQEFMADTRAPTGSLPLAITVEFLADDPSTNRVLGDGAQSVWEWVWRKLGLGLLLLGFCLAPGVGVIRSAILEVRRQRAEKGKKF